MSINVFAQFMELIMLMSTVSHWVKVVMASKTGEAELHDFTVTQI